jgi:hypothetical protein
MAQKPAPAAPLPAQGLPAPAAGTDAANATAPADGKKKKKNKKSKNPRVQQQHLSRKLQHHHRSKLQQPLNPPRFLSLFLQPQHLSLPQQIPLLLPSQPQRLPRLPLQTLRFQQAAMPAALPAKTHSEPVPHSLALMT